MDRRPQRERADERQRDCRADQPHRGGSPESSESTDPRDRVDDAQESTHDESSVEQRGDAGRHPEVREGVVEERERWRTDDGDDHDERDRDR